MTPVVVLQSLARYCPICEPGEVFELRRLDGSLIARIACPHCVGNLPVLIATAGASPCR